MSDREDLDRLISARLEKLFAATGASTAAVAEAVTNAGDVTLTRGYLHDLRTGARTNPSYKLLAAIAKYFDVSTDYFTDSEAATRIDSQIEQLVVLRESGVSSALLRSLDGLSAEGIRAVIDTVRVARYREGLTNDGLELPASD